MTCYFDVLLDKFFSLSPGTSFLLETLVHAKEKLLIKNWADLLLSQYEQSSLACLWLLETLTSEDWLLQVMVKCPIQNIRHVSCHESCCLRKKRLQAYYFVRGLLCYILRLLSP